MSLLTKPQVLRNQTLFLQKIHYLIKLPVNLVKLTLRNTIDGLEESLEKFTKIFVFVQVSNEARKGRAISF